MVRRAVIACLTLALCAVVAPAQATAAPAEQAVTVTRPEGQLVIGNARVDGRRLLITIADTRSDDPGWTLKTEGNASLTANPPFETSDRAYSQRATVTRGLVSAPAHHGLGIAEISIDLATVGGDLTITVI